MTIEKLTDSEAAALRAEAERLNERYNRVWSSLDNPPVRYAPMIGAPNNYMGMSQQDEGAWCRCEDVKLIVALASVAQSSLTEARALLDTWRWARTSVAKIHRDTDAWLAANPESPRAQGSTTPLDALWPRPESPSALTAVERGKAVERMFELESSADCGHAGDKREGHCFECAVSAERAAADTYERGIRDNTGRIIQSQAEFEAKLADRAAADEEDTESLIEQLDEALCTLLHKGDETGVHDPRTHLDLFYATRTRTTAERAVTDALEAVPDGTLKWLIGDFTSPSLKEWATAELARRSVKQ